MATHTRYPDIKRWAESTGRLSIQLWMAKDTVRALDRLCRERGVRRAQLLDALIAEADSGSRFPETAVTTQGPVRTHGPRNGAAG